jgi:hypothetical protein
MSKFLSPLRVEQVEDVSHDGRGTWRLLDPLVYDSDLVRRIIVVPAGFVTDFASVPRVPFAYWIAGDVAHPAAVVHDWEYTSHDVDRATADAILEEAANVADGPDTAARNKLMKWAVRLFGGSHWDQPGPVQPEIVKPFLPAT